MKLPLTILGLRPGCGRQTARQIPYSLDALGKNHTLCLIYAHTPPFIYIHTHIYVCMCIYNRYVSSIWPRTKILPNYTMCSPFAAPQTVNGVIPLGSRELNIHVYKGRIFFCCILLHERSRTWCCAKESRERNSSFETENGSVHADKVQLVTLTGKYWWMRWESIPTGYWRRGTISDTFLGTDSKFIGARAFPMSRRAYARACWLNTFHLQALAGSWG